MNFLKQYEIVAAGNEAPDVYHMWAGISALSSFISRRVWVDQGAFTVYPNLYVVLVGDPAQGKSTAMNLARRLVRQVSEIAVAPSSITREALTQLMGEDDGPCKKAFKWKDVLMDYSHLSVFANELSTLLGAEPIKMIELLTDIWDQPVFEVKTKNKGTDVIVGPYLTLLGCMTPEITGQMLKQSIITGGFSRRCLFVGATQRRPPVPRPVWTPEQQKAWEECVKWGKEMQRVCGQFMWGDCAIEFFDLWYAENYKKMGSGDLASKGYYRSKPELLLKVSMLVTLSKTFELTLKATAIQEALGYLNSVEGSLEKVFTGAGRNEQADVAGKIMAFMEGEQGEILERKIHVAMFQHGKRDDVDAAITHLVNAGKLLKNIRTNPVTKAVEASLKLA